MSEKGKTFRCCNCGFQCEIIGSENLDMGIAECQECGMKGLRVISLKRPITDEDKLEILKMAYLLAGNNGHAPDVRELIEAYIAAENRIKELEGAALSKNHCISILAKCTADLWQAVVDGVYDSRELVGDTVLPMQESLLEIGIDVREKPLNTEALKE